MMPLSESKFGKAEAEVWLRELLPSYQHLATNPNADSPWQLGVDGAEMVPACLDVIRGKTVRFVRSSFSDQSAGGAATLDMRSGVVSNPAFALDAERAGIREVCAYWSRVLIEGERGWVTA